MFHKDDEDSRSDGAWPAAATGVSGDTVRTRPGGRNGRNREAVGKAVLSFIRDGNFNFEIKEIAALSGVHRTTIFRRWPDREAMIAEALAQHTSTLTFDVTGDWKADVRGIACKLAEFFGSPVELTLNRAIIMADNPVLFEFGRTQWWPLHDKLTRRLVDAQREGHISHRVDAQMVVMMLVSTLLTQTLFTRKPVGDYDVNRLVNQLIELCLP